MSAIESRQVAWWPVHAFVAELLAQSNSVPPAAGTPAWCGLANGDPLKLLAVAVAGEHHVLRVETAQEAAAEASKSVSTAADWPAIAQELRQLADARRTGIHIPRAVTR